MRRERATKAQDLWGVGVPVARARRGVALIDWRGGLRDFGGGGPCGGPTCILSELGFSTYFPYSAKSHRGISKYLELVVGLRRQHLAERCGRK